jgi:hypothetical protein
MKKLAILMVLLMAAPLFADATVTITDNGDLTATVSVAAPVNIVGMGLEMSVDAGTVDALSIDQALMNIYMDAAYTEEAGDGYAYGEGTPICDCATAGEIALPQASFCVSAGMLNGETVAGADGYAQVDIQVTVSEAAELCVAPNALRGGAVDINGDEQVFAQVCADVTGGGCACWGDATGTDTAVPEGGNGSVNIFDLQLLVNLIKDEPGFTTPTTPAIECFDMTTSETDPTALADADPDGNVNIFDLQLLVNAIKDPGFARDCVTNPIW